MRFLVSFIAIQAVLSWAAAAAAVLAWGYAWPAAALHGWGLAAWWSLALLGAVALRRRSWALLGLGTLASLGPWLLLFLHAVGHAAWGGPLTGRVLLRFASTAPQLARDHGLSLGTLALGAGLAALLSGLAWRWALPRLQPALQAWAGERVRLLGLGLLALSFALALSGQRHSMGHNALKGEPFALLLRPTVFEPRPERRGDVARDQALREAALAQAPRRLPTVVLIVADALRPDRMSSYGYGRPTTPYLDTLAADPRSWRPGRALAAGPDTAQSLMALLASREAPRLSRGLFKLNEALGDQGWSVNFLVSGDFDWLGLKRALGHADLLRDGVLSATSVSSDDQLLLQWMDGLDWRAPKPLFLQLHLMSTHTTGYKDPAYLRWQPAQLNGLDWHDFFAGRYDALELSNRYDNGVLQADSIIRGVMERLGQAGRLDDALVVITGDHGEALGERGRFGHSLALDKEMLDVPLYIWDSRGRCCPGRAFATHLDVAPTVLRALDLPRPASWQGQALQDKPEGERWHYVQTPEPSPERALYLLQPKAAWKLRVRGEAESLVELLSDPDERRERRDEVGPELLERMRAELRRRAEP